MPWTRRSTGTIDQNAAWTGVPDFSNGLKINGRLLEVSEAAEGSDTVVALNVTLSNGTVKELASIEDPTV